MYIIFPDLIPRNSTCYQIRNEKKGKKQKEGEKKGKKKATKAFLV
jgi:hypothetical protein